MMTIDGTFDEMLEFLRAVVVGGFTLWIHCMWLRSCSKSLMYPSQISQMTKFPFPPWPCPGWPGLLMAVELLEGDDELFFFWPGLFRPGSGVMEILGELVLDPPF